MSIDISALIRRLRQAREEGKEREEGQGEVDRVVIAGAEGEIPARAPRRERAPPEQDEAVEEPVEEDEAVEEPDEEAEDAPVEERRVGLKPRPWKGGEEPQYHWEEQEAAEESALKEVEERSEEDVDLQYPLIPKNPDENEPVYASAHITYDEQKEELIYHVREPELSARNEEILATVEDRLKETIDVDFGEMKRDEAREFLRDRIDQILSGRQFNLSRQDKGIIQYYAFRNFVGLGKIEPLMNDKYIEDVSCDGTGIPVYVYHRNPDVASVQTNVVFDDEDVLDSFVRKLAQRCGRSVSMAEPLVDGSLPDGSRVQATLGTDIARRGSNFTIRKFTEDPLTPIDIMEFGTISAEMLAYLWIAIENGRSILIAGPTAAGKTSLLNALSLFIPPELKVISIEDTPELRLPHPNWVPEVARSGFGFGSQQAGEVTLDDLLEESLRQRPDYIIVGEVRGEEAYILFQQIATGHPGMSTLHASSLPKVMDRLTTKPIDLPPSLIENLDIIVFIKRVRRRGKYMRRVDAVYELEGFDPETEEPEVNKIFEWDAATDSFANVSDSSVLAGIADERGIDPRKLQNEVERREAIVDWMDRQEVTHYTEVGRIASNYYRDPNRILQQVEGEV